ncbi:MAG TPA: WD40 repeat domain-containing protein, partial [Isosphaeraceae bacterium]
MSRPGTTQGGAGNGSRTRRRHWLVGGLVWGAVLSGLGGPGADDAEAQAQVRERTRPIVALDTGGHHAPVQAVAVTPDGRELISGGLDKVIGVWSIGDGQPERTRTIRPPIWRGLAGAIYALALSPPLIENPRQRLLAVAGFGVDDRRGNIALYRYPGVDPRPTGDLVAGLPSGGPGPVPTGHIDTVTCLAFSPDGKSLVSGSNDGRVLIWDVNRRTVVGELAGHNRPVNALAVTPDGRFVLTAGADGVLRIFDFAGRKEFSQRPSDAAGPPPGGDPLGVAINLHGLAVSPRDGRWAAIGREDGRMTLFEVAAPPDGTAALRKVRDLATGPDQGAVEAVAFSPDGTRLASSIVHQRLREPSELPSVACDIEIRDIPADRGRRRIAIASNLVYALAFHPDGRRLVFAGGDAQSITVSDLADPERPPQELAGQGSSLWDVGFRQDSRAIGFSRQRTGTGAPETFEGFDLFDRAPRPVARGELVRALESLDGWTVRPVDPYTLDVRDPDGRSRFLVRLDPLADRRWWSYSFIPGGPGHPDVTLAVGCEAGVAFFRLKDGRRTRLYAGHSGPVYALAPAPDGRWLVTGSSDQTARIWRL